MSRKKIGLIVEDDTDYESLKEIIPKINTKYKYTFDRQVGSGKGRIKNKLDSWVNFLNRSGCHAVVVVIDADTTNSSEINSLRNTYQTLLDSTSAKKKILVVTVFELETWFLYDTEAIKKAFNIHKKLKAIANPEALLNAKEKLRDIIEKNVKSAGFFYSTNDNRKIAQNISVTKLKKCSSFRDLHNFLNNAL